MSQDKGNIPWVLADAAPTKSHLIFARATWRHQTGFPSVTPDI